MNKEFKRMQELAGVKLQENINEVLDDIPMFVGWGSIPKFLGGEEKDWTVSDRRLSLYTKADGMGPTAQLEYELMNKKEGKYLKMIASLVGPGSRYEENGNKTGIQFRKNDKTDESKSKEYIKSIQNELASTFNKLINKDLKSLGKLTVGSGYEDKVTEEDKKAIMGQINSLKSNKDFKIFEGKESLNEHQIGGIVGVGAINHPKRKKSDYEMAFEHFMTEGEEKGVEEMMDPEDEITGTDIDDIEISSPPNFGDDEITGTKLEEEDGAMDVKTIDKILPKINTKAEYMELLPKVVGLDIAGVTPQAKKSLLLSLAKELK